MSGTSDNRWRVSGPNGSQNRSGGRGASTTNPQQQQQQPQQLRNRPSTNPTNSTGTPPSQAGNVWTSQDRSRNNSNAKATSISGNTVESTKATGAVAKPPSAVASFNSDETKEYFKQAQRDALVGDAKRTAVYKPTAEPTTTAKSGAWGSKANIMANGQDFWVQLMKQVAARAQGGGG